MVINTLREFIMETKNRARYEAPTTEVLEVKFEGIICQSGDGLRGRDSYTPTDDNPFGY